MRETPEPFVSNVRAALSGRTQALEDLSVELYARGLSTRDIEDAFTDQRGRRLLSRAAVSEITERLWALTTGWILLRRGRKSRRSSGPHCQRRAQKAECAFIEPAA